MGNIMPNLCLFVKIKLLISYYLLVIVMNTKELKKEIKRKRKTNKTKIIMVIGKYNGFIEKILNCRLLEINTYEDIFYPFFNLKEEIVVLNIDIKFIDKLKEINEILKPDIVIINEIPFLCIKRIKNIIYKYILKGLRNLSNKTLIMNDNDNKIFLKNLDIYRYGNNAYDDIKYYLKNNKIEFIYNKNKYIINKTDEEYLGYIILGLLFGIDINELIEIIEKN